MHVILFQMRAPLLTLLVISALLVTGSDAWGWRRVWRRVVRVRGWGRERETESQTDRQTERFAPAPTVGAGRGGQWRRGEAAGPGGGGLGGLRGGAVVATHGLLAARVAGVVDQHARRRQVGVPRAPVVGQQGVSVSTWTVVSGN